MGQGVAGDFFEVCMNGWDMEAQFDNCNYTYKLTELATSPNNVGVHQTQVGVEDPSLSLSGLVKRGQAVRSAHNLLSKTGIGAAEDTEIITLVSIGDNKSPVVGDYCIGFDGTVVPNYGRTNELTGYQKFTAGF